MVEEERTLIGLYKALGYSRGRILSKYVDYSLWACLIGGVLGNIIGFVGLPLFLFVGRMMWYKGIRIILDALKKLSESGRDFRMVFVGGGNDKDEIVAYCESLGLSDRVFFVAPIHDRSAIRAWYCRGDLFLFPSMLIVFVCYELGFTEYALIVPALTIAGVVLLLLGAVSYFLYDPYRLDRKNHKKANRYIRDIEKAAIKEVELEEKALAKQAKKQEKLELKEEARQKRAAKRREWKKRTKEVFSGWKESIREKLPKKKQEPPEILENTKTSTAADPMGDTETSEQTEQTDAVEMTVTEEEQTEKSVDTEGSGTTSMEEA